MVYNCSFKYYKTTLVHPSSLRAFELYQEHSKGCCCLGDLNMRKKKWINKQTNKQNRRRMLNFEVLKLKLPFLKIIKLKNSTKNYWLSSTITIFRIANASMVTRSWWSSNKLNACLRFRVYYKCGCCHFHLLYCNKLLQNSHVHFGKWVDICTLFSPLLNAPIFTPLVHLQAISIL